ncbi:hypothetical protein LTR33_004726 [Friedmanniomyces endolithicus]|nr:hypothetical protein LTR33_004726 [Friedmanniomyces endolithicus]
MASGLCRLRGPRIPGGKKPRPGKAKADDKPPEDEEFLDEVNANDDRDEHDIPSDDAEDDFVDEREPFAPIAISASSPRSRRLSKQFTHTTIASRSKTTYRLTTQKKTSSTAELYYQLSGRKNRWS